MDEATNQINEPDISATQDDDDDLRTTSASTSDYDEDTEQLRSDIEDTRADMSQTINEIQERLSPEHLMGQVKETVREATIGKVERVMNKVGDTIGGMAEPARDMMDRAGTTIKDAGTSVANSVSRTPIPIALIGLGVGMLLIQKFRGGNGYYNYRSQNEPRRRRESLMGQTGQLGQTGQMGQRQQSLGESASDLANRSTQALSDLGSKAKDSASQVSTRFSQLLHDNPLAVGAVAVAAGTAVGLVLPSTRFESEYIGETGERLVDKAEDLARGALDKVQDAAKQMAPEQSQQPQQQPRP